jgi:drug/metabolite transporter (DMT)-like permease
MNALPRAIGVVLLVVGVVWILQGIGVAQGSVMTGRIIWALIGGGAVVAGVIVLLRALKAAQAAIAADPPPPPTESARETTDEE